MALFGRSTARDDQRAAAWRDWMARREPLAVLSLVLGLVSLLEAGALIVPGVAAIVLGVIALRRLRRNGAAGRALAGAGIVLGTVSLVLAALIYRR